MRFTYTGHITRWIDGDTLEAVVDLGFAVSHKIRVRLDGINAPETDAESSYISRRGKSAAFFARKTFPVGELFPVKIETIKQDPFGRWISRVFYRGSVDISAELLKNELYEKTNF